MSTITGRAAIVAGAGAAFEVVDVEFDDPGPGQVRVQLVASGFCHSDLTVQAAGAPFPMPGILGHEGAGIVESVGEGVTAFAPGDKVLMSFSDCGACAPCLSGHPAYCAEWFPLNLFGADRGAGSGEVRRDGEVVQSHLFGQSSFATVSIADERSLVKVDPYADLAVLAPLGCGIMTGVGAVWNVLDPGPADIVAVYGVGGVGLSGLWAAAQRGPEMLIAIDRVAERLDLATEFGATHVIDASTEDVAARLTEITAGRGVSKTLDTTAHPAVASQALDSTATGGSVLICGIAAPGTMLPVEMTGLINGKSLAGVAMGDAQPRVLLPALVADVQSGRFPLARIQKQYSLDDIALAAEDMRAGRTVKPVLVL